MNNRHDKGHGQFFSEGILLNHSWVTKEVMWLVNDIMEDDDINRTMAGSHRAAEYGRLILTEISRTFYRTQGMYNKSHRHKTIECNYSFMPSLQWRVEFKACINDCRIMDLILNPCPHLNSHMSSKGRRMFIVYRGPFCLCSDCVCIRCVPSVRT